MTDELSGSIERVLFRNEETGFSVAVLAVSARESVTIRGILPAVQEGESVILRGVWTTHPKFGRQFEARECSAQLPVSVLGIKKYLSSGMIVGIGPALAGRMVGHFGVKTLEVIDQHPRRLCEVDGIGPGRAAAITAAWQEQKEISRVMVFLQEHGVSPNFAVKIFKIYGQKAIEVVRENPYRLAEDIWGVGFKSADAIALNLGFARDSLFRVKSGIARVLGDAGGQGHVYADLIQVLKAVATLLGFEPQADYEPLIKVALRELYHEQKIILVSEADRHLLALPSYHHSEIGIAKKILLLQQHHAQKIFDLNDVYAKVRTPDATGRVLNDDQQRGILACLQEKVVIITGGPGTGKTTLIRRLLELCEGYGVRFKLAAPTGRAAKRMFEGTARPAETIHRLLAFSPATMTFTKHERDALDLDVLVVDEASMLDIFLLYALLRAVPQHARLVLIGDVDQLPSVGAGNVLHDLIASERVTTIRLTTIFRQAQDSLIITNAHRVNSGEFPRADTGGGDFIYIREQDPANTALLLRRIYGVTLQKYGVDPSHTMVLCPMNRGVAGTINLNTAIQAMVNPPVHNGAELSRMGTTFRGGDRVMQIRNNYDKFVFNGDIGIIEEVNLEDRTLTIQFGGRSLVYAAHEFDEIVLAYAISIHKSQGSEFAAVIIPVFMQHFVMLRRNLIYTALTRAKKLCVLVGEPRAIAMAIKNTKGAERVTLLKKRMSGELSIE